MTIGIITANFGRLPILEIFCAGIKRLREETGFNIPCVSVGDADGGEILAKYSIAFVEYPNTPLTAKFNRACTELQSKCDYVLIMGSDDLDVEVMIGLYQSQLKYYDYAMAIMDIIIDDTIK